MTTLPKPMMRGLLRANIKKNLLGMILTSLGGGLAFHMLYCAPRKQAYADFYKTYDPEAAVKIMNDAGLMQSCPK